MPVPSTLIPSPLAPLATATVHPSSVLRAPDDESRRRERELFFHDLDVIAQALRAPAQTHP